MTIDKGYTEIYKKNTSLAFLKLSPKSHGDRSKSHGDRSKSHGDRSKSHGDRSKSQEYDQTKRQHLFRK